MTSIDYLKHNVIIIKEGYIPYDEVKRNLPEGVLVDRRIVSFYKKYMVNTQEITIHITYGVNDIPGHERIRIEDMYCADECGVYGFSKGDYITGESIYARSQIDGHTVNMLKGSKHSVWIISKGTLPPTPGDVPNAPYIDTQIPSGNTLIVSSGTLTITPTPVLSTHKSTRVGAGIVTIPAMNGQWTYSNTHPLRVMHMGFNEYGFDSFVSYIKIRDESIYINNTMIKVLNGKYQIKSYVSEGISIGIVLLPAKKDKLYMLKDKLYSILNV